MRPRTFFGMIALAIVLIGLAVVGVVAQSKPAPALTAMDYVQIRQLVSHYAYALDTGGNNGYDFADLFTADGEFIDPNAKGREQLAACGRNPIMGPLNVIHYAMGLVLEATPEGAIGRQYVHEFDFNDDVPPLGKRTQWEVVGDKRGDLRRDASHLVTAVEQAVHRSRDVDERAQPAVDGDALGLARRQQIVQIVAQPLDLSNVSPPGAGPDQRANEQHDD
jgi:hypothetical protein